MPPIRKTPALDEEMVRRMAALLDETGLTEIEFGDGDFLLRVAKAPPAAVIAAHAAVAAPVPPPADAILQPRAVADHPGLITSPMVGVVYLYAEPGAPPFAAVGDMVEAGDTVLMIEAMKVFNPIKALRGGRIAGVLVVNGAPVEYGEPLMIIE